MSNWESTMEALKPKRHPTDLELQAITEVRTLAAEYCQLPDRQRPALLASILDLTTPRQRSLAVMFTEPGTADWRSLMTLIVAIVATQPGVMTSHGWFSDDDVNSHGGRLIDDPKGKLLQFPDSGGVYRAPGQRSPTFGRFSTAANVVPIRRTPEWWEGTGTEDVPF